MEETKDLEITRKNMAKIILEQIELLTQWNKKSVNNEPEQVRKNIETIMVALDYVYKLETSYLV